MKNPDQEPLTLSDFILGATQNSIESIIDAINAGAHDSESKLSPFQAALEGGYLQERMRQRILVTESPLQMLEVSVQQLVDSQAYLEGYILAPFLKLIHGNYRKK